MNDNSHNDIEQFGLAQTENPCVQVLFQQALDAHESGELKYAKDTYEYILSIAARSSSYEFILRR